MGRYDHLLQFVVALAMILAVGTVGYSYVEGWSLADGFYMTLVTLSTVGFGETHELSPAGRGFTSLLIVTSVVSMACFTAVLTSLVLEENLSGRGQARRIASMVAKLKRHIIVCGSDTMAQAIVEQMFRRRRAVVVVDDNTERTEQMQRRFRKLLVINGRGTNEMRLADAGVLDAEIVIAAMDSEVDNLMLGIACKALGDVSVVARANDSTIANSMRKAGIDQVVSPNQLCGRHVVEMIATESHRNEAEREAHTLASS